MHLQLSGGHSDDTEDSILAIALWESIFNKFVSFSNAQVSLKRAIKKLQMTPWNASLRFRGHSEHFKFTVFEVTDSVQVPFEAHDALNCLKRTPI